MIQQSDITEEILKILEQNNLPVNDIKCDAQFYTFSDQNGIIAVAAYESYGSVTLLRSVAVKQFIRKKGYGAKLVTYILNEIEAHGHREIYLVTNSASNFFNRFEFYEISRDSVPEVLKSVGQLNDVCPCSSIVMRRTTR